MVLVSIQPSTERQGQMADDSPAGGFAAGLAIKHTYDDRWPKSATNALPIACSLDDRELALRSETVRRDLFALAEDRRELPDGYAFRFGGSDDLVAKVNAFVATERRCCSFFHIEVAFEPGLGPIWLRLTGPEGVKRFVDETFDPGVL